MLNPCCVPNHLLVKNCCLSRKKATLTTHLTVQVKTPMLTKRLFTFVVQKSTQQYWPFHVKMCLWSYVDSKSLDQPAHSRRLIRAFAVHKQNQWIL